MPAGRLRPCDGTAQGPGGWTAGPGPAGLPGLPSTGLPVTAGRHSSSIGAPPVTSFNLQCCLRGPTPKCSHPGGQGFSWEYLGGTRTLRRSHTRAHTCAHTHPHSSVVSKATVTTLAKSAKFHHCETQWKKKTQQQRIQTPAGLPQGSQPAARQGREGPGPGARRAPPGGLQVRGARKAETEK